MRQGHFWAFFILISCQDFFKIRFKAEKVGQNTQKRIPNFHIAHFLKIKIYKKKNPLSIAFCQMYLRQTLTKLSALISVSAQ